MARRVYGVIGIVLVIAAFGYFLRAALDNRDTLVRLQDTPDLARTALAAISLYLVAMVVGSMPWFVLLRSLGVRVKFGQALVIRFISQFAKYVPGNVAHHVGRMALARGFGIAAGPVVVSQVLELLIIFAVVGIFAVATILILGSASSEYLTAMPPAVLVLGGAVCLVLAAAAVYAVAKKWWPTSIRKYLEANLVAMPRAKTIALAGAIYSVAFLLNGAVLATLATELFHAPEFSIITLSGIYSVAWIVGFLTPGAPAGIGTRDAVLLAILGPVYDVELAVGLAATHRAVTLVGDGLILVLGLLGKRTCAVVDSRGADAPGSENTQSEPRAADTGKSTPPRGIGAGRQRRRRAF